MYKTTDFRKGLKIEIDAKLYLIVESNHVNPGKGSAFVKTRLKNMESGLVLEKTFKSGESVGIPDVEEKEVEYMYEDQETYFFMDQENYETIELRLDQIGENRFYLQEGIKLDVLYYNKAPISIELPNFVHLKVTETDPGLKGDTAQGGTKKAVMETGLQVNVPLFIKQDEVLKIDTRTGDYMERVKE